MTQPDHAIDPSPADLIKRIREIIFSARSLAARSIDTAQVAMNFAIGQRIVEHEQTGKKRAAYGRKVLESLAEVLTAEFGRGFSRRNLNLMRQFYLVYKLRGERTLLLAPTNLAESVCQIEPSVMAPQIRQTLPAELRPFFLSWSHYVFLMSLGNDDERSFYEIEATRQNWDLRTLKRQADSCLYERLALSQDRDKVSELAQHGDKPEAPRHLVRDPFVLEFLGLEEKSAYSERDLEASIIDKLESFLLELGKGFLFEARQKRFTFDSDHFYVDLVFYNRLLRCYVLMDLKIGKLTHQDLGQMQMYVNYFDRHVRLPEENPTVGIILCKHKHDTLVELTLPKEANIYASQYQLYLPSKEELQRKLRDWADVEG
jgi:predicted nuclease of restriction endonuclease-like (RecB) superfamily